jgi:hypothetical protein
VADPDAALDATRRALHGVAELVLAGPQYAATQEIALRVVPGGFATVAGPEVRLSDGLVAVGDTALVVSGSTPRALLAGLGLPYRSLRDVYADGSGVGLDDRLTLDDDALDLLTRGWEWGEAALRRLAPAETPVLWPEHFDVGITVDEVNYGVSPGDGTIPVPYAYVGPWTVPAADEFWTHAFGAARTISDLGDADAVLAFFEEARRRV